MPLRRCRCYYFLSRHLRLYAMPLRLCHLRLVATPAYSHHATRQLMPGAITPQDDYAIVATRHHTSLRLSLLA